MIMRDKSNSSHAILDIDSRYRKAEKILTALQQKTNISNASILEIGTGSGYIAHYLAGYTHTVTSVDIVDERRIKEGYLYKLVHDEILPFGNETFDVVISNHVVEHVANQRLHLCEALRTLKKRGLLYLATPNRLWITDPHYRLPFINWIPFSLATVYLKALRGKSWDIHPVTESYLKKCILSEDNCSCFESIAVEILKNPEKYNLDVSNFLQPFLKKLPKNFLKLTKNLLPTILVVVTKGTIPEND